MKINLIAVGKKMPDWISEGIEHYKKQLPKNYNFAITSIESQSRKSKSAEQAKSLEEKLILDAASNSNLLIAFEQGRQQNSEELSKSIEKWQLNAQDVALIIGGADGLSSGIKQKCNLIWGLSNLTLTHSMARLLVVEQIYRGYTLISNHPYHRR